MQTERSARAFTVEEDQRLLSLVDRYGPRWSLVSLKMGAGFAGSACAARYDALCVLATELDGSEPDEYGAVLAMLQETDEPAHLEAALEDLCEHCDRASTGDEGERFGRAVRASGALPLLCALAASEEADELQALSLRLLANLVSDAVDARSCETKAALLDGGELVTPLMRCLQGASDAVVLTYACAAVQNLCFDTAWAALLTRLGVQPTLEALLERIDEPYAVRYASGALQNIALVATALSDQGAEAVRRRRLLVVRENSAARRVQHTWAAAVAASAASSPVRRSMGRVQPIEAWGEVAAASEGDGVKAAAGG
eukprot:338869-Prymnesium_polylepis.1